MVTKNEFAAFMHALTQSVPRFAPRMDVDFLRSWYEHFQDMSLRDLTSMARLAPIKFEQFPSIKELLELAGKLPRDDDAVAREVAERIWSAIERFGDSRHKEVEQTIGEVAWEVVRLGGGWRSLCLIADYDNATTLKAQWRESAKGLIAKKRAGIALEAAPSFDDFRLPPTVAAEIAKLTDSMGDKPNG